MSTPPTATPITTAPEHLARVKYDAAGLVPAVIQEAGTGAVLMLAYMNDDALRQTLETGRTWFWSRSRQEFFDRFVFMLGSCNGFVQVVNISLVVFAMVDLHGTGVNMWFKCIVRIGKRG